MQVETSTTSKPSRCCHKTNNNDDDDKIDELRMNKIFEYQFDCEIAHDVGIVDGSKLTAGHVVTQNNRGYQMSTTNPLYYDWINAGKESGLKHPIIDIGCAFGVNTLSASFNNDIPVVIALDMTQKHLDYVQKAHETYSHLGYRNSDGKIKTILDSLPFIANVENESVSSILCAEVIYFLNGQEVTIAFKRFYDILIKGGHLHLSCVSAYAIKEGIDIRELINERKKSDPNNEWPGYFNGDQVKLMSKTVASKWKDMDESIIPLSEVAMIHHFTASQIAMVAENAGFIVKSIKTTRHSGYPPAIASEYSSVQLIAIKL